MVVIRGKGRLLTATQQRHVYFWRYDTHMHIAISCWANSRSTEKKLMKQYFGAKHGNVSIALVYADTRTSHTHTPK